MYLSNRRFRGKNFAIFENWIHFLILESFSKMKHRYRPRVFPLCGPGVPDRKNPGDPSEYIHKLEVCDKTISIF